MDKIEESIYLGIRGRLDDSEAEILEREIREGRVQIQRPSTTGSLSDIWQTVESRVIEMQIAFDDNRDDRDPAALGEALLALRRRAPKSPLSRLYDRHRATLDDAGR